MLLAVVVMGRREVWFSSGPASIVSRAPCSSRPDTSTDTNDEEHRFGPRLVAGGPKSEIYKWGSKGFKEKGLYRHTHDNNREGSLLGLLGLLFVRRLALLL